MPNTYIKDIGPEDNHILHRWIYADATTRLAATGFITGDLLKWALQLDNHSYWLLTATTPTWVQETGAGSGTGGTIPTGTDTQTLRYNSSGVLVATSSLINNGSNVATTGRFLATGAINYADFTDNRGVFIGQKDSIASLVLAEGFTATAFGQIFQYQGATYFATATAEGNTTNFLVFNPANPYVLIGSTGYPIRPSHGYQSVDGTDGITEDIVIGSVTLHVKNGLIVGHIP